MHVGNYVEEEGQEFEVQNGSFWVRLVPWLICAIATVFYCYAYVLRAYPSVMEPQLRHHFLIDATTFGTLTAFYYYAYTPMQLFVGVLLDRFGARGMLTVASAIATVGLFIFVSSHNLHAAEAGRFMLGVGAAFAYVTALKLTTLWLHPKHFAMMAGLTTGIGMLAAGLGDVALTKFVQVTGYQHALYMLVVLGVILTVCAILFVRNAPKNASKVQMAAKKKVSFKSLVFTLIKMFANPQMWVVGIIGMLLYMPASIFLDVYGIPYLERAYQVTPEMASMVVLMVFLGWVASGPFLGILSDKIGRRRLPLTVCSLGAAALFAIVLYVPGVSVTALFFLFFGIGMCCGVHPLCFAVSRENNPIQYSATSISLTNAFIMVGGFLQPFVGFLLDSDWKGQMSHGVRFYTTGDYHFALSILPIGLVLVAVLTFFMRETHCKVMLD